MRNVILITIDALRADHLPDYGYHRETTPQLKRLSNDGIQFNNAYSVSSHTRESVPSILTGRYPDEAIDSDYELDTDTIATLLPKTYSSAAFHSNPFVSRVYGFSEGFDEFYDDLTLHQHKYLALFQRFIDKLRNRHYARAEEIQSRATSWLNQTNSPFFLWTHYMDVHGPYEPPEEFATKYGEKISDRDAQKLYQKAVNNPEKISDEESELLCDLYDAELHYVDSIIGKFVDWLQSTNRYSDTIIIVTSDHGDAFGEYDYYAHPSYKLDDILVEVPLIVAGGPIDSKSVDTPVSTLDIVPSILDIVGNTHGNLSGTSLLETASNRNNENRIVYSQSSGSWKDSSKRTRLFAGNSRHGNFTVERDFDTHEVLKEYGDVSKSSELAKDVMEHSEARLEIGNERAKSAGREQVNDRLEALGYKE